MFPFHFIPQYIHNKISAKRKQFRFTICVHVWYIFSSINLDMRLYDKINISVKNIEKTVDGRILLLAIWFCTIFFFTFCWIKVMNSYAPLSLKQICPFSLWIRIRNIHWMIDFLLHKWPVKKCCRILTTIKISVSENSIKYVPINEPVITPLPPIKNISEWNDVLILNGFYYLPSYTMIVIFIWLSETRSSIF